MWTIYFALYIIAKTITQRINRTIRCSLTDSYGCPLSKDGERGEGVPGGFLHPRPAPHLLQQPAGPPVLDPGGGDRLHLGDLHDQWISGELGPVAHLHNSGDQTHSRRQVPPGDRLPARRNIHKSQLRLHDGCK